MLLTESRVAPPHYAHGGIPESAVVVKGGPVIALLRFIAQELTPEQRDEALARIAPDIAKRFREHLLSSEKVPLAAVNQITVAAAEARGEAPDAFAFRAGKFGADQALKSIFKPFFLVGGMKHSLKIAPLMWGQIYNAGTMVVEAEDRYARIIVTKFASTVPGCGRALGWFTYIGEFSGAKTIKMRHDECMALGARQCVYEAWWS